MIDIEAAIHQCPHCDGLCARDEAALQHNYPCRDINCPGYLSIEEGGK